MQFFRIRVVRTFYQRSFASLATAVETSTFAVTSTLQRMNKVDGELVRENEIHAPDSYFYVLSLSRPVWCCLNCGSQYNSEVIEQTLIEVVQRMSVGVVVQDLVCTKCRGVSILECTRHAVWKDNILIMYKCSEALKMYQKFEALLLLSPWKDLKI